MPSNVDTAVAALLEVRKGKPRLSVDFCKAHPLTFAEALQVQEKVTATLGTVGGWKVAPGSTKENPSFAPVIAKDVLGASESFAKGRFQVIGVECEIAFRMGKDLGGGSYTREQVADAIEALVPLIEICETRLADAKAGPPEWRMADSISQGAIMIGKPITDWRSVNVTDQPLTLTFNGEKVADVPGSKNADLVAVVTLLANQVGKHCGGIKKGQIVTTGSMSGNIPAKPGTEAVATFKNLGVLKAKFA